MLVSINGTTRVRIRESTLDALSRATQVIGRFVYDGTDLGSLVRDMQPHLQYVYWQIVNGPHPPGSLIHYRNQLEQLAIIASTCGGSTRFIPFEYVKSTLQWPSAPLHPLCGFGTSLRYIAPSGSVSACDELAGKVSVSGASGVVERLFAVCRHCSVRYICRTRCPAIFFKHGIKVFKEYCTFTRVLMDIVARYYHRIPQPFDELFAVTEVIP